MSESTREPQYQRCLALDGEGPRTTLGLMSNQVWIDDPKRLGFTLARYKFVAKLFEGYDNVLEIGCGDGFATRIVANATGRVTGVDFDPLFIEDAVKHRWEAGKQDFRVHNMLEGPVAGQFDGIYSLDVLEHINPMDEHQFLLNVVASLETDGCFIVGIPSLESQTYASPPSREGHVNCKSGQDLKKTMLQYFRHVFVFSMNDEVVHTGFYPMAHYLLALCCGKREL